MIGSLPEELLAVIERSATAEFVSVDAAGQPVTWPVRPGLARGEGCIDVAPEGGAAEARADAHVALLFSDPEAVDLPRPAMVLIQGTARVGDAGGVRVRPERVMAWSGGDLESDPQLFDAHIEEVRSAHNEEPETGHAPPEGGPEAWDERLEAIASAVLAFVGPDRFPFAVRVPVRADRAAALLRIEADPVGAPIEPGPVCLSSSALQIRGDLDEVAGCWVVRPHRTAALGARATADVP
jgi:hypothetical protein